jgi:hypothetical protein
MSDPKPLALIAVNDGRAGEFFWISMDGNEETCNSGSFLLSIPEISEFCVVIKDSNILNSFDADKLSDLVARRIGRADVCVVDAGELYAFTKDEALYRIMLHKAIDCMPDSA